MPLALLIAIPPAILESCQAPAPAQETARLARHAGRFEEAASQLERHLATHPADADAWLELGLSHAALGRDQAARAAFGQTLRLAPNYDDAHIALARLDLRAGDAAGAAAHLAHVSPTRAGDGEVLDLRRALAARTATRSPARWRIDVSAAASTLSNDLPSWREAAFALSRRAGPWSYAGAIEAAERFGRTDVYAEARLARAAYGAIWTLALGGTPDADFRPERLMRLEVEAPDLAPAWDFAAAATFAQYATGDVDKLELRAARRFGEALSTQVRGAVVRDEFGDLRPGYALGATWRLRGGLAIDASWADAPESSDGATVEVRALTLGVAFQLSPNRRLRIGLTREQREAYERTEALLAVAWTL